MNIGDLINAEENNFEQFLFFDIEVFAEDSIVVFKDINGTTLRIYHNDFEGLGDFITDKVLVGYNNYNYDDYILTAMMLHEPSAKLLKDLNDSIIHDGLKWQKVDDRILSLDCFQQINVAKSSLKKIEANIGLSIDETAVPFDIDRALTEEELEDTITYCERDVEATRNVFNLRWKNYFVPKLMILNMLPEYLRDKALRWNTTTITAQLLTGGRAAKQWDRWQLGSLDDTTEMLSIVPDDVAQMWREATENTHKKCTVYELGCAIEFSQGGLHGRLDSPCKEFTSVKLLDVTSLYPNILIKLDALGDATKKYKEIVDKRISVKHTDETLSGALKIVINSTYGLLKNKYSKLYNPMAALSVCIYGQIILYDLCVRLYNAGCRLININTDGVAFTGGDDVYEEIQKEWEDDYGFELELSEFTRWYQKDVNNYVAKDKDDKIKVKGIDMNKYFDPTNYLDDSINLRAGVTWTSTNKLGIISRCLVDKIIYDISFIDTIQSNLDNPILFQYILQAGRTYVGIVDDDGNWYQKVNRVFASKIKGLTLKKKKEKGNPQYFPDAPDDMYVYNGDLREFKDFKKIIDVDYYNNLAQEKYDKLWN